MDYVQATESFVRWMRVKGMAKNTISNYSSQVRIFGHHFRSVDRFRNITSEHIMDYLLTKVAVNSQRQAHSALKLFYTNIVQQPLKFRHIPYAKKEKKLPQPLETTEISAMLRVCCNTKHQVILFLLYGCGLRIQELIDLKWKNIDRESKVIHVIKGKGKKDRKVQLYPELIELLTLYYREYRHELAEKEFVLCGVGAIQYSQTSVNQVLKSLARKAGIRKRVHAHLFRHSYATHLLDTGTDIRTIQELLGHASSKTTEIYTHVSNQRIASVPSPMSRLATQ